MQSLINSTKICNLCKVEKSIRDYHPNKSCKLGVTGTCKPCSMVRVNQWCKDNRNARRDKANNRNRANKQLAVDRFNNKCYDCGNTYPNCVYQFHHLDPTKKDMNPSYSMSGSKGRMWEELSKCVMLCANCHMIRHHPIKEKEGVHDSTTH